MKAKTLILSTAAILAPAIMIAPSAAAQSTTLADPSIRSPVDEKGVDLTSGEVIVPSSSISIGGANGLAHVRTRVSKGWPHNYLISAEITNGAPTAAVNFSGARMTFDLVGGIYESSQGTGETIAPNFSTGTHVLTLRDGTEVVFKESHVANGASYYGAVDAVADLMTAREGGDVPQLVDT
ncbi:MAG: hypothetical protein AAF494_05695 [Pseudomonadota bacterium]